jgi:glutamyl-tRNA synthetase
LPVDVLVKSVVDWANKYGNEDNKKQIENIDYLTSVLSIERDNPKRIRKDFITWQQTLSEVSYFWDFLFKPNKEYEYNADALREFLSTYNESDDKDTWWQKIVYTAEKLGLKPGDVAMNLRVAMTGRTNTPDLYSLMQVLGGARVKDRINMVL